MRDQPKLIGRGGTAEVYAWKDGQVLKLFFDWVPESWVQREVRVAQLLTSTALPTPKFIEQTTYANRNAIVYEKIEGPSMLRLMNSKPWQIRKQARYFARLHEQINQVQAEELPSLKDEMGRRIEEVKTLPADLRGFALQVLSGLPDGNALCHYDFHPDQIVVSPRGPMVLDWMEAFRGDAAADVAHTTNLLTMAIPPKTNWLMDQMIAAARGSFFRAYKNETQALRPELDWAQVERWRIPTAAARLRADITEEREALISYLVRAMEAL